jgi:hypothetical protein
VAARDGGQCRYCHLRQVGQASIFHIDHIVPRSRGGATVIENLALQCPACSLHKANKTAGIDPETQESAPLFHPLVDAWDEHFELRRDGMCVGLSSVGRATVEALRMNDALPKVARAMQIAAGLL